MCVMEIQLIAELVLKELTVKDLVSCTLVSKSWSSIARTLLKRYHFNCFGSQIDELRCFELHKSTISYLPLISVMRNLRSLTVHLPLSASYPILQLSASPTSGFCLSSLLSDLPHIRHLYINGPDARYRSRPPSLDAQVPFTSEIDQALVAFRDSRLAKGLPGLTTLSIASSADVTWQAIVAYLSPPEDASDRRQSYCGLDLRSLSLANCPQMGSSLLEALYLCCPDLSFLSLKKVDRLFNNEAFPLFPKLVSLSLSIDVRDLPADYFQVYQVSSKLQCLSLTSSKHIQSIHLSHFSSINKLIISGCPALGTSLSFPSNPDLQEVSYLGRGLDVASVWSLWQSGKIRKLTLDAASLNMPAVKRNSPSPQADVSDLPKALKPFATSNLLSPSQPSWVLAYLISLAPPSLEAISIIGLVEEDTTKPAVRYTRSASCPYGWTIQEDCQYTPWGFPSMTQQSSSGFLHRVLSWLRWPHAESTKGKQDDRLPILPLPVSSNAAKVTEGARQGPSVEAATSSADRHHHSIVHEQSQPENSMIGGAPPEKASIVHDESLIELLQLPMESPAYGQSAKTMPSRLTAAQLDWVRRATNGRIVRLEV